MFKETDDLRVIKRIDASLKRMEDKTREGRTFIVTDYQGEPRGIGAKATPIFVKMSGLKHGEDEGMIITNGLYTLFVDEVSESGFSKLYMYASGEWEYIPVSELKKPFTELC